MISLAESLGLPVIDWEKDIRSGAVLADPERYKPLARDFNTCAVGQLSVDIPRTGIPGLCDKIPLNRELGDLAVQFCRDIGQYCFHKGESHKQKLLETLQKIKDLGNKILSTNENLRRIL